MESGTLGPPGVDVDFLFEPVFLPTQIALKLLPLFGWSFQV